MSLINEALKKAQAQRHSGAKAPVLGHGSPGEVELRAAAPSGPTTSGLVKMFAAVLLLSLIVAAGISLLIARLAESPAGPPPQEAAVASSHRAVAPAEPASDRAPPDAAPPSAAASSSIAGRLQETTRLAAERTAVVDGISDAASAPPADDRTRAAVVTAPSEPVAPPVQTARPEPVRAPEPRGAASVREFLESVEIRGISMGSSRVLIYESVSGRTRSFQKGELIQRDPQVRIFDITQDAVVFEDGRGTRYVKYF